MKHTRSAVLAVLALLAVPFVAHAQGVIPSDSVLRGFQPSGEFVLIVDGVPVPAAEIFQSEKVPGILILTSALPSPVLLSPRTNQVQTVNLMKVSKQKDGSVDLLADAVLSPAGQFTTEGENVSFAFQGKKVRLNSRPALLGVKSNADLKGYLPDYVRGARNYTPNAAAVADLKKLGTPVTVRVFFGSWCPHCRQHVPLLLKVEDQVQNPKLRFEYYGLPRDFNDPEAKKAGIHSVPIGIVYVNGKETGRITGEGWSSPEVLLDRIVTGPSKAAKGK
ncbi:MAG TPA: thioredoxin family protein [Thermoanaerobaculia bacterium]|nr:thioredoxin family protein [Thermoanaerobaculia bacterium]